MFRIYEKIKQSIKYKVIITILILSFLPMLIFSYIAVSSSTETLSTNIKKELEEKAFLVGGGIDRFIHQRVVDIKILSQADVLESNNNQAIIQYITEITLESEYLNDIDIIDITGQINLSSGLQNEKGKFLKDLYPSLQNIFLQVLKSKQGDVFVSEAINLDDGYGLAFLTPITDDTNTNVIKVLMTEVNLKSIKQIVSDFDERVIGNKYVYLVDNNGFVIITDDPSIKEHEKLPDIKNTPKLKHFFENEGEVGNVEYIDSHGDLVIAGFADMHQFGNNKALDWSIIAIAPVDKVYAPAYELSIKLILLTIFILLVIIIISVLTGSYFANTITKCANIAIEVSKGNLTNSITNLRDDELGKLQKAINDIIKNSIEIQEQAEHIAIGDFSNKIKLRSKDDHLSQSLINMNESLSILKSTQSKLIESEKMAALGSLVSGVAHEVNTPLGNALTGVSLIKQKAEELEKHIQDNTLKKSSLEGSVRILAESSRLVIKSISNAVDLIKSFKQISVDQTNDYIRVFDIRAYVEEIFLTFHNKLKKVPVEVEIISEDKIELNSNPGAISQIINNLITNSLLHAFDSDKDNAKITVTINEDKKNIYILFEDNGCGMSKKFQKIAFDPFVTTKRNEGGTGLGLNVTYNIIHQKLNGHLKLISDEGVGSRFEISIPKNTR